MKRCFSLAFISLSLSVHTHATTDQETNCISKLEKISISVPKHEQYKQISELEKICSGIGYYEYIVAKNHIGLKQYDFAQEAISKGLSLNTRYSKILRMAQGDLYLHQKRYALAEKQYAKVAADYSDRGVLLNHLAFAKFAQGKFEEALIAFEQANEVEKSTDNYKHIILSAFMLGRHKEAIYSLEAAYEFDPKIIEDVSVMLAASRAYASLEAFELSKNALGTILSKHPELEKDKGFIEAVLYLKSQMASSSK